ncbi:MAG: hypothetical protein L0Z73_01535 [Gammaproteobacteria bacterium]|nr:hypothetical protein [Gammaproteobacteria bacterium]
MTDQQPMVYVDEPLLWEYKHLVKAVRDQSLPAEEELNSLGAQGWELAAAFIVLNEAHFYFMRVKA